LLLRSIIVIAVDMRGVDELAVVGEQYLPKLPLLALDQKQES
jgi:hypothetical protein